MVATALLIAFGIIIPTVFKPLQVQLPPAFTATIGAHVPIFIAMCISPMSGVCTAIGTTLGFLFSGIPFVVVARAASHIFFVLLGAYLIKHKKKLWLVGVACAVVHALFEALTVYLFFMLGITPSDSGLYLAYTTGVGTFIHHAIDFFIAVLLIKAMSKAAVFKNMPDIF